MTDYEIYVFILCLIVFIMLTSFLTYLLVCLTKQHLKMIRHGLEDTEIRREYRKTAPISRIGAFVSTLLSVVICLALCAIFAFSIYLKATEDRAANGTPALHVVKSDSMSYKAEENTYLTENSLDDQIQIFDLIITRRLPDEKDLQLYDVVVYQIEDTYVIHRIVQIEEPNSNHPDHRWFRTQGDAVPGMDRAPVVYEQMRGIYEGERIPFVGSFVLFMQSPAGWLCILLVIFGIFTVPVVEKKLEREKQTRLEIMRQQLEEELAEEEEEELAVAASAEEGARHV